MLPTVQTPEELLEQTGEWLWPNHFGSERRETAAGRLTPGEITVATGQQQDQDRWRGGRAARRRWISNG